MGARNGTRGRRYPAKVGNTEPATSTHQRSWDLDRIDDVGPGAPPTATRAERRCCGYLEHRLTQSLGWANAERAFDEWLERYDDKYPKATAWLTRDRDELLAFYNFPAVHWTHLRTTNVIESALAQAALASHASA